MNKASKKNLNVFRLLRIVRDIKTKDLAETLQVTPAYINAIENGEKFPSKRLLRDYAKALGVAEETILAFNSEDHRNKGFDKVLLMILRLIGTVDGENADDEESAEQETE